ncbi:MAG: PEP-CTERM sorting domain-containing protein [Burkholderiaceae bacterium]|nr:PEP-CTERM sorting domain-containing protein [Burkholderiaceae bacterium]
MKKIRETFVRATLHGALYGILAATTAMATPAAHAAVLPLQQAVITATYNGDGASVLGLDHGFVAEPGSNTSAIYPSGAGVEFFTADALFGFDFNDDGTLVVYNNAPIPTGDYRFRFDFGASLAAPLVSFTVTDMSGASGIPLLSLLDGGRVLGLDLSGVTWADGYGAITATIADATNSASVPEPRTAALLLGGLGLLALTRRRPA